MSAPQASSVRNAGKILDRAIAQASEGERDDLVRGLTDARRLLVDSPTAARAELRASMLGERAAEWQRQLYDSFATIDSDVEVDLQQRIQAVRAEAEQVIAQSDPAKDWDALADWLRARLVEEARANHDLAVSSCRQVSQQAAQHFKISDMHIVDPPLTPIPTELPTQLVVDETSDKARITVSLAVHSLVGAWIGVVMFFLLTNVLGLRIPVLLGLVPTLLLGWYAIAEDRRARLEDRRAQAVITLRDYLTDFGARVSKDSRDLLRRLERELSEAYRTRVERQWRAFNGQQAYVTNLDSGTVAILDVTV